MLSLLLDEQISPKIAQQINQKYPEIPILSIHNWQNGFYLGIDDATIILAAADSNLTLVTYDQNTIPPILVDLGGRNIEHGGVVFVDYRSIPPNNFGSLVKAIIKLWQASHQIDWKNRIVYLRRA